MAELLAFLVAQNLKAIHLKLSQYKGIKMAEITINNQKITANEGEYLLNVARANGIFIPAICYLSGCSPTLACKLCMVEADGKRVYSCNAKVKDGMTITTNTPEINAERKAIMQSYCVNHPLECGVCDKSGECELQDFTLLFGVDNQSYFVADSLKKRDSWGQVKYDPSLCILCERCVTACKDNLGEANLKVIKSDSIPQLDSAKWKEIMPKDAFSVWNRKQKGVIGFVGENPCNDCVECVSVCPVGALGVKSFQYTTNAWELQKVDSTCNLCPAGCKIVLEGKKDAKNKTRLYRVTNDFNFNPICAGGRFGQEISGESCVDLSGESLNRAISAIHNAKAIKVGGNTTNNEAKFLQSLKNALGLKLINYELENYFKILEIFGDSPLATLESIGTQKLIISVGGNPKYENPLVRYKINNALKMQKDCAFVFASAIRDTLMANLSKKFLEIIHAPNAESAVILAICGILDSAILDNLKKIQSGENEYYEIFENANIKYEAFLELQKMLENTAPLLIIGSDFYSNKNAPYIANLLAILAKQNKIKILLNPPSSNANGIYMNLSLDSAQSCETLDNPGECSKSNGKSQSIKSIIGWRTKGEFTFDSINADFVLPYFSAINDSIVNLDNRILPINALFSAPKYLEMLYESLNLECDLRVPKLQNFYDNSGADKRGEILSHKTKNSPSLASGDSIKNSPSLAEGDKGGGLNPQNISGAKFANFNKLDSEIYSKIAESTHPLAPSAREGESIDCHDLAIAKSRNDEMGYLRDIAPHFYPYTRFCAHFTTPFGIYVSKSKMQDLALSIGANVGDKVALTINGAEIRAKIYIDFEMDGDFFAISPQIDGAINAFKGEKFAQIESIKKDNIK
ncbi:NADH-quinone oxidoreductase subunit G [Helicobacter sp. 23-1045]